jgi:endonuclease/exonuclease/phosphatase family metal-dependent hydrolase
MPKQFSIKFLLFLFVTCLLSCRTALVYKEPNKPVFYSNNENPQVTEHADSLNVVTFNIKKAEKIQLATSELQVFEQTNKVDVYLLQEMDEQSVVSIARELNLNYLYYPIVFHKKDIGNAILTRGTITSAEKLILPHSKWLSKRLRHVTIAEVTIQRKKILVYSVHTETMMMSRKNRMDQIDAIIKHAKMQLPDYKYVLIGGDFNTLFTKDARSAVEKFTIGGFDWSTAKVGSTARAFSGLIKPRHDYVFSQGLKVTEAYKIATSKSSDHYPVFATFTY